MTDQRPPRIQHLRNDLRCVLADNPSPMTYWGTNTFILGTDQVAIIDPGPDDPAHLQSILSALAPGERITHIFVTHAHIDHSPMARTLSDTTGAPVIAYGDSRAGQSAIMRSLAKSGLAGGGEGVDHSFTPDILVPDCQTLQGETWHIAAHWTPGHFGNHMCFEFGDFLFTGDLIMGWASSLVSPPDGDLTDFMASLEKIAELNCRVFLPAHGPQIIKPAKRLDWLINHRLSRKSDILHQLSRRPANAAFLAQNIYYDTPKALLGAAERNVFAHLIDLVQSSRVLPIGPLAADAEFKLK